MGLGCGGLVLLPYLDRLVALRSDHPQRAPIKFDVENGRLTRQRPRLDRRLQPLEAVAALPIIEMQRAVVCAAYQHIVLVEGQ